MMKNKIKMSHVLLLILLAALLFITPLLSSSLRQTYLYFIMNLLIIALGAEAGLLKAFSNPLQDHHQDKNATTHVVALAPKLQSPQASRDCNTTNTIDETHERKKVKVKVVEKSKSEKVNRGRSAVKILEIVKCPSLPSLFFIEGDDDQVEEDHVVAMAAEEEEEQDVAGGDLSGQELFTKAEMFIGNFYKQMMIQRKDSYKKIHGF